jgi:hypothetical protein
MQKNQSFFQTGLHISFNKNVFSLHSRPYFGSIRRIVFLVFIASRLADMRYNHKKMLRNFNFGTEFEYCYSKTESFILLQTK